MILAPVSAAAVACIVFVAPALNQGRIPADERPAPDRTATPVSPRPPATRPSLTADGYRPVDANVIVRSPGARDRQVTIDKGRESGLRPGDPVIDEAGLVGTVASSTRGSSVVTLITDQSF